jgi:NNP family nitrate/nitrite transporter-like MFS transporter
MAFCLIGAMGVYNQIVVGALGPLIMEEYGMSQTLLANMTLAPLIASLFLGLLTGNLGDKWGPTKVIDIFFVVTIAGVFLRIFVSNFVGGFIAMLLIGVGAAAMGANMPKLLAAWFKPSQMGLAVGITMIGMAAGTGLAQATGALLGGPTQAFTITAIATTVLIAGFMLIVRDRPAYEPAPPPMPKGATSLLGETLRNPHAWLIAIGMALFSGWQMIFASQLPTLLVGEHELDLANAGALTSSFAWGGLAGCIIMPSLAAALGKMKPVIMGGALLAGVAAYAAWMVAPSPLMMVFLALAGCGGAAISCLITTAPALMPSIGPAKAGTAGGLMGTVSTIGGYALPSLICVPIAIDYLHSNTALVIMGAAIVCLAFLSTAFLPEFAPKKAGKPDPQVQVAVEPA